MPQDRAGVDGFLYPGSTPRPSIRLDGERVTGDVRAMRIVHTSDWHAGRSWKGVDRLDELGAVLDALAHWIEENDVDLVLHTGDVFDSGAPSPRAEARVFGFFRRIGRAGVPSVVLAGNHDSPARTEAWGNLAELVGVRSFGVPPTSAVEIVTRRGEVAVVAPVPFAPARQWVDAEARATRPDDVGRLYADGLRARVDALCAGFRPDAVNLLMLHTHVEGAVFGTSERRVHLGSGWVADRSALPSAAHYVALGHLHVAQALSEAPPAVYAGAPLQLDFGEAGQDKSFVVVDVVAGGKATIRRVPYVGGRPLETVAGTLDDLEARREALGDAWLSVVVRLDAPDSELRRKVKKLLPNAVQVDVDLPEVDEPPPVGPTLDVAAPVDVYADWVRRRRKVEPRPELLSAFEEVMRRAQSDGEGA